MAKAAIGARVMFCGHKGWFVADIHQVGTANVVVSCGPVNGSTIIRTDLDEATHHMVDFPLAGYWKPEIGLFVVPIGQVKELAVSRSVA